MSFTQGSNNASIHTLITQAYNAFNSRDIAAALALMSDTVSWPKASEGGRVVGKDEIRAYWTRQWSEFDPNVEPLEISEGINGVSRVRVRQLVKSLAGEVLSDSEVMHIYTVVDGRIERMDLGEDLEGNGSTGDSGESDGKNRPGPTAAFSRPA